MAFVIILPHSNWHARVDWRHSEQLCTCHSVWGLICSASAPKLPLAPHKSFHDSNVMLSHPHVAELPHLFIIPYGRWCPTTSRKAIVALAP